MQIKPELKTVLKRMRLSPMLATLPDRVTFAREQKLDFTEFLELVLNDEAERRDQVSIQTRLRNAGFEEECTLERFDWTSKIELDRAKLNDLFGLHFVEKHENVIFTGGGRSRENIPGLRPRPRGLSRRLPGSVCPSR